MQAIANEALLFLLFAQAFVVLNEMEWFLQHYCKLETHRYQVVKVSENEIMWCILFNEIVLNNWYPIVNSIVFLWNDTNVYELEWFIGENVTISMVIQ